MQKLKFISASLVIAIGLLAGWLAAPMLADAAGHIGLANLNTTLRTYPVFRMPVFVLNNASGNTTDTTDGIDGVLAHPTLNAVTTLSITSFSPTPYPCKLELLAKEATNDGTLTCTGDVSIVGKNYLGETISETITSDIVEATPVVSAKVYASVTSITTSGCSGGAEAGDVFRVACSNTVGLPWKIQNGNAFLSICGFDASANSESCYTYSTLTTGETDVELATAANGWTANINVAGMVGETPQAFGGTIADGDALMVRFRWPAGE